MIATVYDGDLMKSVNFFMTLSPNRIVNRHSIMFEVSISRCCQWQHQWALFLTSSSVYSLPFHLFEVNLFWQVWSSYLPDQNWQANFDLLVWSSYLLFDCWSTSHFHNAVVPHVNCNVVPSVLRCSVHYSSITIFGSTLKLSWLMM